jgi:Ca2+-binding EF-hand superfamily protein
MFDKDNSGQIEFHEFEALWKYIEQWKTCFQSFDKDRSGSIDRQELQGALKAFGYNVSDKLTHLIIMKFDRGGKLATNS